MLGKTIDLSILPNLQDTDYFRPAAIYFKEHGCYTHLVPNKHPDSDYIKFWREEERRCLEGYTRENGDWVSGYHYFYLNYSPIWLTVPVEGQENKKSGKRKADRIYTFPRFWDGDYLYFHYIEQAEFAGQHGVVLKSRGKGYSFKAGSMLARNFYLIPGSKSYAVAEEKEYLTKDGLLTKAWDVLDWIDTHTPWAKAKDKVNLPMHKRASYIDSQTGAEKGIKSEIIGISLKNDPDKAIGKRGKLMLWEESGKNRYLKEAWQKARPSFEQGDDVFGFMVAYGTGGCLTAGNKVWNNYGELVNIENLDLNKGIIGYKENKGFNKENITYWQKPIKKECVKIITNTERWIECSLDHPIYKAIQKKGGYIVGNEFIEAKDLNINDYIGIIEDVNIWSNKNLEWAREIGWLIGDGTYGFNQSVRIANCEKEIIDYLERTHDCKTNIERLTKSGKTYKEIRIKNFPQILRNVGIYGQTKLNKTLPENIHSYSKESVCEFLGGLFDTDGYVCLRKNKKRNSHFAEISISQANKPLLLEIQLLLQKLGIHGTIRTRKPRINNSKDVNEWFEFVISDCRSLVTFCKNIKLFPSEKQKRLNEIYNVYINIKPQRKYEGLRYEKIKSIINVGIKEVYNLTADNTHTYIGNGIITHNTEGANFEGLEELFYSPDGYNIYSTQNVWDDGRSNSKCGFFVPEYMNREGCYDEDGNSDIEKAKGEVNAEREKVKKTSTDPATYTLFKSQLPFTPQEAIIKTEGTIFPVEDLKAHLAEVESHPIKYTEPNWKTNLIISSNGEIEWKYSNSEPIRIYPLKDTKNVAGCIEIFEQPIKNSEGIIPFGIYIAATDPYDDDGTVGSLGSTFVMNTLTGRLVAEYTGRPNTAEEYYENVWRLCKYYNAVNNYENNKKGMFSYFDHKNSLHLLADTPKYLADMEIARIQTTGNKSKGTNATKEVNAHARRLIKTWLVSQAYSKEEGICNLHTIKSPALLRELISWNIDGNFDRVSALGMLMILKEDRNKLVASMENKTKNLALDPFFVRNRPQNKLRLAYQNNLINTIKL